MRENGRLYCGTQDTFGEKENKSQETVMGGMPTSITENKCDF